MHKFKNNFNACVGNSVGFKPIQFNALAEVDQELSKRLPRMEFLRKLNRKKRWQFDWYFFVPAAQTRIWRWRALVQSMCRSTWSNLRALFPCLSQRARSRPLRLGTSLPQLRRVECELLSAWRTRQFIMGANGCIGK